VAKCGGCVAKRGMGGKVRGMVASEGDWWPSEGYGWLNEGDVWLSEGYGWLRGYGWLSEGDVWLRRGLVAG
jgi:hypothetical protein